MSSRETGLSFPIGNPHENELNAWKERRSNYRQMVRKALKKPAPFDSDKLVDIPLLEFDDSFRTRRFQPSSRDDEELKK